jgi:hypothetical protein
MKQYDAFAALLVNGVEASARVPCQITFTHKVQSFEVGIVSSFTVGPSTQEGEFYVRFFEAETGDGYLLDWRPQEVRMHVGWCCQCQPGGATPSLKRGPAWPAS